MPSLRWVLLTVSVAAPLALPGVGCVSPVSDGGTESRRLSLIPNPPRVAVGGVAPVLLADRGFDAAELRTPPAPDAFVITPEGAAEIVDARPGGFRVRALTPGEARIEFRASADGERFDDAVVIEAHAPTELRFGPCPLEGYVPGRPALVPFDLYERTGEGTFDFVFPRGGGAEWVSVEPEGATVRPTEDVHFIELDTPAAGGEVRVRSRLGEPDDGLLTLEAHTAAELSGVFIEVIDGNLEERGWQTVRVRGRYPGSRCGAAGSGTASAVAIATDAAVVNPRQCVLVDLDGDHRALRSERGVFTIQARAAGDCIVELELADVSLVAEAGLDASLEPLVVDVPPRVVGGGGGGDLD